MSEMPKQENTSLGKYNIKLLAKNVVLVESNKYESEIFTPRIVNGRITFLNIIPNRRCCQIINTNCMNFINTKSKYSVDSSKEQNFIKSKQPESQSSSKSVANITPLANSTPNMKQSQRCGSQLSNFYSSLSSNNSTLLTPEPARRAIPASNMIIAKSPFKLPKSINVSRIYQNRTPTKVGRLVTSARNVSLLDSSFRLPCSPIPSKCSNSKTQTATPADCIERWRKVLTPVRTYTRIAKKPIMINRPKSVNKLKMHQAKSKVTPTYLHNPTQGLDVSQKIEIKKVKLIIDSKTTISPRSFKKQQTQPVDCYAAKSSFHLKSLSFHKPRSYLDTFGMSAFDLLTNSNRKRLIARKLNEQLRKGCVNKASSTYSKYKIISEVPRLDHDEQVLEISRISLQRS